MYLTDQAVWDTLYEWKYAKDAMVLNDNLC